MRRSNVKDGLLPNIKYSGPVLRPADTPDEEHLSECQRPQQHQYGVQGHIFPIFPEDTQRTQNRNIGTQSELPGHRKGHNQIA